MEEQSASNQNTSERFVTGPDSGKNLGSMMGPGRGLLIGLICIVGVIAVGIAAFYIGNRFITYRLRTINPTQTQIPSNLQSPKPPLHDIRVLNNPQQNPNNFVSVTGKVTNITPGTITIATDSATKTEKLTPRTVFMHAGSTATQSALPVTQLPIRINDIITVFGVIDQNGDLGVTALIKK